MLSNYLTYCGNRSLEYFDLTATQSVREYLEFKPGLRIHDDSGAASVEYGELETRLFAASRANSSEFWGTSS